MTPRTPQDLDREASEWFARLNASTVSASELEAFRAWRSDPACRRAYEAVEAIWRRSGDLAADPQVQAAVAAAASPRRKTPVAAFWPALAAAAVVLAAGVVFVSMDRPVVYETEMGERRTVRLTDGSELQLDAGSRVRVRFDGDSRDLELARGQALFDVARDVARPFRVTAGDTLITATGTRFDVRRDGVRTRVTLVEGSVLVATAPESGPRRTWRLRPGEQVATGGRASSRPTAVDPAAVTSWTEGRLTFDATPLAVAVAEVNRYARAPVVLGPGVDGRTPVSGVFHAGDGRAFAEAVAALHGLELQSGADALRLVASPENIS